MTKSGMGRQGGWVVGALVAVFVGAGRVQAQGLVPSGVELALALEAEAARLHSVADRWADAADLYVAAAQLRQHEDPQARADLFLAANLYYEAGDKASAVFALEAAAARAAAAGDAVLAMQMFANAALVAEEAGLANEGRRLRSRLAELAQAARGGPAIRS